MPATPKKRPSRKKLKPVLPALLVAPNAGLWSDIIVGRQTGTIRTGHRDYEPGPVMLCCPWASACVQAEIVSVRRCRLDELTDEECRAAGFAGRDEAMLEGMRAHYKDLTWSSDATMILWKDVQGTLVERRQLMMAKCDTFDEPVLVEIE